MALIEILTRALCEVFSEKEKDARESIKDEESVFQNIEAFIQKIKSFQKDLIAAARFSKLEYNETLEITSKEKYFDVISMLSEHNEEFDNAILNYRLRESDFHSIIEVLLFSEKINSKESVNALSTAFAKMSSLSVISVSFAKLKSNIYIDLIK